MPHKRIAAVVVAVVVAAWLYLPRGGGGAVPQECLDRMPEAIERIVAREGGRGAVHIVAATSGRWSRRSTVSGEGEARDDSGAYTFTFRCKHKALNTWTVKVRNVEVVQGRAMGKGAP